MTAKINHDVWPLFGIWRWIAGLAVMDAAITVALISGAFGRMGTLSWVSAVACLAFATGVATTAALAFWARDRWLQMGRD